MEIKKPIEIIQTSKQPDPMAVTVAKPKESFTVPAEFQPAHWVLSEVDQETIEGRNNVTGRLFKGSRVEFNNLLKGV
jgi:hypothetical protein